MYEKGYLFLFASGNDGPFLLTADRAEYAMRVAAVTTHSYLTDNILTVDPDGTYPITCLLPSCTTPHKKQTTLTHHTHTPHIAQLLTGSLGRW